MNNTAGRGVVLAVVAVVLGVIILGQGFDDTGSSVSAGGTETPTATPTDDGDAIEGDGTDEADTGGETEEGTDTETDTGGETDEGTDTETDTGGETDEGTTRPAEEVRVLVANDTTVGGTASRIRDTLVSAQGYNGLSPTNTTTQGSGNPSVIYFAEGYRADARNIAQILGLDANVVDPMPASPPVEDLANAHVLVVIGPDLAGA